MAKRRIMFAAMAMIGGLSLVPVAATPAAAGDFVSAQVEVDIGVVSCTVIGRSRVAFDPSDGADGTSLIEFATTLDDTDPECADWMNRIGAIASYRREQDEDWLTTQTESFGSGQTSSGGTATVPGQIVDAEVFHYVEFFDHSCSLPPQPRCGPFGADLVTNPK